MRSRLPKVLHPLCGKPMLSHVVDAARRAGYANVLVVVPPDHGAIRDVLGDDVGYAVQERPQGSGDALKAAAGHVSLGTGSGGEVAVLSGDVPLISAESLRAMQSARERSSATVTLLTARMEDPSGLGRVVRGQDGGVTRIVEDADADDEVLAVDEINSGIYLFDPAWLWDALNALGPSASGETYLTDLVAVASRQGRVVDSVEASDPREVAGVNDRVQLAGAEATLRERIRERWMLNGVSMPDPDTVYIDATVVMGRDTLVRPNTHLLGATEIGEDCDIGPNSVLIDSVLADRCRVVSSFVSGSRLASGVSVGPFSNVRDGSVLKAAVRVGNFTEVKASVLGEGTRALHLSYIGDADIGSDVNVGAGTITCNYDGQCKHRTTIGDGASIGSDTMLVAPVKVGPGASTGAGSVVTKDVPAGMLAVGVPAKIRGRSRTKAEG